MKALLFDMDGVLVNVSESYRLAIKESVERISGREVSLKEIQEYKSRGGWNDDWALTRRILEDRKVVASMRRVIEVFQSIYLGENFDGLIHREHWLLNAAVASALAKKYPLGIVTGRPRREALYALSRFPGDEVFRVCVTRDDLPEGRGKPDPLGLMTALSRMELSSGYYAGDSVDDMKAAVGAGLQPVGVIPPGWDDKSLGVRLRQNGAQAVIRDINRIGEALK